MTSPSSPLLQLVDGSKEVFALVLLKLSLLEVHALAATCWQLRTAVQAEGLLPALQAVVSENTQELIQRNIAARSVRVSRQAVHEDTAISPCGSKLAWRDYDCIYVRSRQPSWQMSAPLPAVYEIGELCWSHDSNFLALWYMTKEGRKKLAHVLFFNTTDGSVELIPLGRMHPDHQGWAYTTWALSAQVLAVYPIMLPCSARNTADNKAAGLYLVQPCGQRTGVRNAYEHDRIFHPEPLWAPDSLLLLMRSPSGYSIYDETTQQHHLLSARAVGSAAWSPGKNP